MNPEVYVKSVFGTFIKCSHVCIGVDAANAFMLANPGHGLLHTDGGVCFIAEKHNLGFKV